MKKNGFRVIHICGIRGILLFLFIISCLIAGFVAFPTYLTTIVWNFISYKARVLPSINIYQGALLWGMIALSTFIFNKKKLVVSFKAPKELSEDEVQDVVSRIKKINSSFKEDIKNEDFLSKK